MDNYKPDFNKNIRNESGFTLLEILAVIVILGILGVVAVPKYYNLQANARDKTMAATEAEVISRVNGFFAEQVLSDVEPKDIIYSDESLSFTDNGLGKEFVATVESGGEAWGGDPETETPPDIKISIKVDNTEKNALTGAKDRTVEIPRPGI